MHPRECRGIELGRVTAQHPLSWRRKTTKGSNGYLNRPKGCMDQKDTLLHSKAGPPRTSI